VTIVTSGEGNGREAPFQGKEHQARLGTDERLPAQKDHIGERKKPEKDNGKANKRQKKMQV